MAMSGPRSAVRWFEQQRQDWIAETLRVFGFINRGHLERKFGISTPQASLDLNRFKRAHPNLINYDMAAKRYVGVLSPISQDDCA